MSQKVSVIVPIYKVENYIHRCVDSILEQTYTNLEIILVNDGSPDNCGMIIDDFATKDNRIIVVHKDNGGLSDARNAGMEYVTGEYILFVDSDDWLDRNMIKELVNISLHFKAEIVQSAFYYAYEDHLLYDNRFYKKNDNPIVLDNKALMTELVINERVKNFAWGKLYKTEIIKELPFKKGVLFEDVFWAHQVMLRVNTYVIMHVPLCYYFQRSDSIVSNYSIKNLDIIDGLKERHRFLEQYYQELTQESYRVILKNSLIHYNLLLMNRKKDKAGLCKKEIYSYIKQNNRSFQRAVEEDKELKKQLSLFLIHPYLNIFFLITRKVLRKLGFLPRPVGLERINISYRG
ncbi:glycosyltransferase family 2 protein [Lederbergia citrea]|uniref:glycosyltransferase family 2 protein n=1 Tax=Lederbergia citrea TaxID=2833581 RepID=UPI001BC96584|nr:glycosyltransferase family 2 protein [Lederbergia citrea]MBS4179146.1 glycosyltransferase [Lederbergia citrea]